MEEFVVAGEKYGSGNLERKYRFSAENGNLERIGRKRETVATSVKQFFKDFIVIQTGYWPDSNLGSVFIIKIIFIMKNVTDFLKTVETGVDPRLLVPIFALISKPPLSNRANPGSPKGY